jgi:Ca2+/H+ antiporter
MLYYPCGFLQGPFISGDSPVHAPPAFVPRRRGAHSPSLLLLARPLIYTVAAILPFSYLVGLLFTLKTHSHIFSNSEGSEHDAPHWSKLKAIVILGISIVLFSLVAEELVKVGCGVCAMWQRVL